MSRSSQSRILSWLSALALTLLTSLQGCDCGSTGADSRRYPCTQDTQCVSGFVCLEGMCQPEGGPVDPPDGGADAGTPDGGGTDGGGADGGGTDGGGTDGGGTDGGKDGGVDGGSDGGSDGGKADGGGTDGGADAGTPDGGSPPQPTQLNFITPAQTTLAGRCSGAVVVETQDSMGSAAPVDTNTILGLNAQPDTGFAFYRDAACSTSATFLTMPAGSSRATFYFRGTVAPQSVRVSAVISAGLFALQNESITPAAPAIVSFITEAQTLPAGGCSSRVELEAYDAYGNLSPFSAETRVTLSAQPSTGFSFFTDPGCTSSTTEVLFSAGSARTRFYFKGKTGGRFTLSAATSGLPTVSQDETILPAVRTNLCTLPLGARSVTCPISPPQLDLSKTLLMFQASSDDDSPDTASLRCSLTALDSITCSRNDGDDGDEDAVDIVWQTAELPSGLKVQHLQPSCGGAALTEVPIQPVSSLQSTFLLVSSEQDGSTQGDDDFYTASISATNHVDLQFSISCISTWKPSLQVVELTGATVTRGVTGPMSGTTLTVSLPQGVNLNSSALLFTYRASDTSALVICDRVLRGALSSNAITFTRGANATGCTVADIDAISWELIDFGARASAQHVDVTMDSTTSEVDTPITAVDRTRTLVFASGQAQSGQAGGETSYAGDDVMGASIGWHGLRTPTILTVGRGAEDGTARWQSTVLQLEP
jgi:hypothetical protein